MSRSAVQQPSHDAGGDSPDWFIVADGHGRPSDDDPFAVAGAHRLGFPSPGCVCVLAFERDLELGTGEINLGACFGSFVHDAVGFDERGGLLPSNGTSQRESDLLLVELGRVWVRKTSVATVC